MVFVRRRNVWPRYDCSDCFEIIHPVGICINGCVSSRLFDGYCKDWKDIDKMKSFISSHGEISDDFSVIVISTTARSGESIRSFNPNSGKPYIDMKLYKFPCLKDVIINRKKLSLYTFSWIIVDHTDNYYCSGTDDFTNESRVYQYVISKSLADWPHEYYRYYWHTQFIYRCQNIWSF